jgi:MFS family permease
VTRSEKTGWPLVAALGITQIIGYGSVFYSFSPLMHPLQASLSAGKGAVVGAFSLALFFAAASAVWIGRTIDRHGGRYVMAGGSAAAGILLFALSRVETLPGLYAVYAGLGVSMSATLYEPAFAVLTRAFGAGARRAITALTLIAGFASTIFWPLTQYLIDRLGWHDALLVLGFLNLVVCVPLHLAFLSGGALAPASVATAEAMSARSNSLEEALRSPVFYCFAGALVCNGLIFSTMSVHILPVLAAKGLTPLQAAAVAALIGPMQVAGRIVEVTVGRAYAVARVGRIALSAMPVALLLLLAGHAGSWALAAFAILYGASNGVFTIVRGAMPAELFGRENYGAINGALSAPYLLSHASGPFLAAILWGFAGESYDAVILGLALVAVIGVLLFVAATRNRARSPTA